MLCILGGFDHLLKIKLKIVSSKIFNFCFFLLKKHLLSYAQKCGEALISPAHSGSGESKD
jgi:hypothetical protein